MGTVAPNYTLIKKYFTETGNEGSVGERYFQKHYDYYKKKPQFEDFTKLLNEYGLSNDYNIYFFWTYYFDNADYTNWYKEIELFKIWNSYNADLISLKKTYRDWSESLTNTGEPLFIKSISFELINSKGIPQTTTIKTPPLLEEVFEYLGSFIENMQLKNKPKEKNVKAYLNSFILSTEPFFYYMKNTHFPNKSKNKVYDFMGKFINTVGIDLQLIYSILPSEHIKSIYTKRGKSVLSNT